MALRERAYTGDVDRREMLKVAQACPTENLHAVDLPYRLSSWALDEPRAVRLWVDEAGRLQAWAILQAPFWTIDYAHRHRETPEMERELHRRILLWADGTARALVETAAGRPAWYVNVFERQHERRADLETAGFVCQSSAGDDAWSKVLLARSACRSRSRATLPAGFALRLLAGDAEVGAYVALHRSVFESRNMTAEWRRRTLCASGRHAELDLVAVGPAGQLVGFCVGWLAKVGPVGRLCGQIEPLGVERAYRRLGLGAALLEEMLSRMHDLGAEEVFVETDSYRGPAFALYAARGFTVKDEVLVYRKDFTPPWVQPGSFAVC